MPFEEHQHSLSESQIARQHRIAKRRRIADVKDFGRLKNYFSGCRGYDTLTFWARRGLIPVRIDPAYKGN
jgi:hypothetical protein